MGFRFLLSSARRAALLAALIAASGASAQDIFVTPIPNAPFTGVIRVERSEVGSDGSVVNYKTIRNIARDSQGRIRNESRELLPVSSAAPPRLIRVLLYDPQTRISTLLYPETRTFSTMTANRPPQTVPPAFIAATTGNSLPQNEFAKQEDLGTREVEGLSVHGVRQTQIIPPNANTDKEVVVTDESWYSEDLRINLMMKHNDPRTGTVAMTVAQIARTEPEPRLFEIPEGYATHGAKRPAPPSNRIGSGGGTGAGTKR